MKKSALYVVSFALLSTFTLSSRADSTPSTPGVMSGSNPRPQVMSGSNPRPQVMSGSNPRPQVTTGTGGTVVSTVLSLFGVYTF